MKTLFIGLIIMASLQADCLAQGKANTLWVAGDTIMYINVPTMRFSRFMKRVAKLMNYDLELQFTCHNDFVEGSLRQVTVNEIATIVNYWRVYKVYILTNRRRILVTDYE